MNKNIIKNLTIAGLSSALTIGATVIGIKRILKNTLNNSIKKSNGDRIDYNLVFDDKESVSEVLNNMKHLIKLHGSVTISEMYDLADVNRYRCNYDNYGWTSLDSAKIITSLYGYEIRLPKPKLIVKGR